MGDVNFFLGTAFTWIHHKDGNISAHICQSSFTKFTAHLLSVQSTNKVPNMTPYRSGFLINSIPPVDPLDPDLNRLRQVYQSIVGCINWLANCTRPGIAPIQLSVLVAIILASQELNDVWFWWMDFQAIGPPERQMRKPEKDWNLNNSVDFRLQLRYQICHPNLHCSRQLIGGILMEMEW